MGTHRSRLKSCTVALLLAAGVAFAGTPPPPVVEENEIRGIDWNVDAVIEAVQAPRADTLDWIFEAALSIELDLGELAGLDHFYVFAHPTLSWGVEEAYGWKARAYLAWLSWDGSEHWNFLGGLYDLGWHFQSLPSASTFSRLPGENIGNFSPGAIGLLDPFPLSAPALRVEWKPRAEWAVQLATVWLDEGHFLAAHQLARGSARWLVVAETKWTHEGTAENGYRHRVAGIGGWVLPGAQLDEGRRTPLGIYAFGDARLWSEPADPEQGLSGFVSISAAAHRNGPWEKRAVTGLEWTGLIPSRAHDRTALAVIAEESAGTTSSSGRRRRSVAAELLHRVPISDRAYVQGSVQWRSALTGQDPEERWKLGFSIGVSF